MAVEWIDDRLRCAREVACQFFRAGWERGDDTLLRDAESLVGAENKGPVFDHWSAGAHAELVLPQEWLAGREKVARVECVIS